MIVNAIYHGLNQVFKIYRNGEAVFVSSPIEFHVIEDGKFVIVGAMSAISKEDGLYLDCEPDEPEEPEDIPENWEDPVLNGYILDVSQVYSATQNGYILEVE